MNKIRCKIDSYVVNIFPQIMYAIWAKLLYDYLCQAEKKKYFDDNEFIGDMGRFFSAEFY